MTILINENQAQQALRGYAREQRLARGLTQADLARRAGVSLSTLRKFEQQGGISLTSYLKLQMVLGTMMQLVEAAKPRPMPFASIDEVLTTPHKRQRGRSK